MQVVIYDRVTIRHTVRRWVTSQKTFEERELKPLKSFFWVLNLKLAPNMPKCELKGYINLQTNN